MSGLVAVEHMARVVDVVLSAPPIEYGRRPETSFTPAVEYVGEALGILTLHDGFVRMSISAEAGRVLIADLLPCDVVTAGLLLVDMPAMQLTDIGAA